MDLWQLPTQAKLGDKAYGLNTDYRVILRILSCLEDPDIPPVVSWQMGLLLFYRKPIPPQLEGEAMAYLAEFIAAGEENAPGEKLFDWKLDAPAILGDINAAAGRDIRLEKSLHWWTFLSFFHGIGAGQLSFLVQLRKKLRRGEKLESWEQQFYREHKHRVDLRRPLSPEELEEKQRLNALLGR